METMDLVMENPAERRAYHWLGAISELEAMLDADAECPDPRGWDDVFVLLRRLAKNRKQDVIEQELEQQRSAHRRVSEQQILADQWTGHADAMDRIRDGFTTEGGD